MEGVRNIARAEKRTVTEVVNRLMSEGIARRKEKAGESRVERPLPVFAMGKPRVNLANRDALEAAMEQ